MERLKKREKKIWKSQISDFLKKMAKIFYDIIPPKAANTKARSSILKSSLVRIAAFGLIVVVSWAGFSSVYRTIAYYSDVEESKENNLTAGILDFELSSTQVFSNMVLSPGSSATGTISVVNMDNIPKYKLKAINFSGALCDYLDLEANLDGGDIEYFGKLKDIDFGPTVFESPDDWFFTLTLPASTTEDIIGETCDFNFSFYGSQTKNDLPFGQGFTDIEDASSNLKAKMCFDSETRSKGYWKNHLDAARPYLPQMLGYATVDSTSSAYRILHTDYELSMINKLEAQLLAMKLNVAHFGIGDYVPTSTPSSVSQIIAEADDLLKQDPVPDNSVLEEMKNLLESLAQDLSIRVCTETGVKVLIPNGGEKWWVGRHYDLTWTTKNLGCPNDLAHINIWYSGDSGATWGNVITTTTDDGSFDWRIPLYLENNTYYTVSDKARIKVVAVCSENLMVAGWDMSDYDFCPPIERDLLTPEELLLAIALGLIEEDPVIEPATSTESQEVEAIAADQTVIDGGFVAVPVSGEPAPEPAADPIDKAGDVAADAQDIPISPDPPATAAQENPTSTDPVATTTDQVLASDDQTPTSTDQTATSTEPAATSTEQTATSTEPAATSTEQTSIIDNINNVINDVVDNIVNAIIPDDATTTDSSSSTTTDPIAASVEQAPVDQVQPVTMPDNSSTTDPVPPQDDSSDSGDGSAS